MNKEFQLKTGNYLYDQYPTNIPCSFSENLDMEQSNFNHHISSLCFQLKKKIKRQQNRPSILKIEDSGRNFKLFSNVPSSNNLEKMENDIK